MVSGRKTSEATIKQIREYATQGKTMRWIANELEIGRDQAEKYAKGYRPYDEPARDILSRGETATECNQARSPIVAPDWIIHPKLPSKDRPVEDIIALAKDNYLRKREHHDARNLINVKIRLDGPIGVTMLGDPHIDDNGCNWPLLEDELDAVANTKGMMLSQIGDVRNNWVGRLAQRLAPKQGMTCSETRKVIEWLFKDRPWLFMVKGNHDHWNNEGGDALDYILRLSEAGVDLAPHDSRIAVNFPNGNIVGIRARHDFQGKSMYNPNHGALKAAQFGRKYDIMVHGHLHTAAYQAEGYAFGGWGHQADQGIVSHFVRLGSYKEMDEYADEIGAEDKNWTASMVAIMNPYANSIKDKVIILPSVEHGCDYLTYLRRRWESGRL